jgi:MSHA biogenesis protein MshK
MHIRLTFLSALLLGTTMLQAAAADPTRPPTPAEIRAWYGEDSGQPDETRWRLQSILISDTRRVAVINDQRVRIGDSVNLARVTQIGPHQVVLVDASDESFTLHLESHRIRSGPVPRGN